MKRKISLSLYKSIYLLIHLNLFFFIGIFTPCKTESHYQEWGYKKKKYKNIKAY